MCIRDRIVFYLMLNYRMRNLQHLVESIKEDQTSSPEERTTITTKCSTEPVKSNETEYPLFFLNLTSETPDYPIVKSKSEILADYGAIMIQRSDWNPLYIGKKCKIPLQTPIKKISVSESETNNCFDYDTCMSLVTKLLIQDGPFTDYFFSHFVVTGDGYVYEGLGSNCGPHTDSLRVLLTGTTNSTDNKVNDLQYRSLNLMIQAYIITGKVSAKYAIGPEYCLEVGKSPSRDMYERLSKSDHFMERCNKTGRCLL